MRKIDYVVAFDSYNQQISRICQTLRSGDTIGSDNIPKVIICFDTHDLQMNDDKSITLLSDKDNRKDQTDNMYINASWW